MSVKLRIVLTFLVWSLCSSLTFASVVYGPAFSPAEHVVIGDNVKMYFSATDPGQKNHLLKLPNGLQLSYGNILTLGDFYGTPNQPIAHGGSEDEQRTLFLAAFDAFALSEESITEVTKILEVIHAEQKFIEDGMKEGEKEEDLYKKVGLEYDRQFNCITGGGCNPSTWWTYPGRYLILTNDNFDHFGDDARVAYKVGHDIAIQEAIIAHQTKDVSKLEYAYAINAYASHFLSDRFATGHIRTPRKELPAYVTPSVVGGLLVNYMHNEENRYGLHVHNRRGDQWVAYGDKSYFSEQSLEHRKKIAEAMQVSADEIFFAYQHGYALTEDGAENIIPIPDEIGNASNSDIASLFYWDESIQKVMRRVDLKNIHDAHWTDSWWGWSTLYELNNNEPLPFYAQVTLAQSELSSKAIHAGLITDKHILDYLNSRSNPSL